MPDDTHHNIHVSLCNILDLIGGTPLVLLRRLGKDSGAEICAKVEFLNPSGSTKDRVALAIIEDAERRGLLRPGGMIVEPTGGNTGAALALVGAAKGYAVTIVMPADTPEDNKKRTAFFGATVVQSAAVQGMGGAVIEARRIAREKPGAFLVDQFINPAGVRAHKEGTGREILEALEGRTVDAFVAGVGTGATLMGIGQALKDRNPGTLLIAVEPLRSPVLSRGRAGPHRISGIGATFVPPLFKRQLVDEVISVPDEDAFAMAASMAKGEGLYAGPSSGANVHAALTVANRLGNGKTVVTVLPDGGDRHLHTVP